MTMKADEVVQILLRERLRVAAVAVAIVRDVHAADDVFQQVVLSALENLTKFREPEHVLAWAIRAARHRAIDLAQRRQVRCLPAEVLDLLETRWADPDAARGWSDQMEALHRCISRLAGPARQLLQMRYVGGLSAAVISADLRRTTDAVYQSLSRIHRWLRKCVESELIDWEQPATEGMS